MRNSRINFNKINFVVCLLIFSNLWASIPKWVSDATNDRYWVGIGIFDSANSLSDEDPSMTAYLRAVEQIAAQMSVSIKASTKYQQEEKVELDSEGNISGSISSSFSGGLESKVEQSLSNLKISKKAEVDGVFYCKVQLDKKKYWKSLAKKRDEAVSLAKEKLAKVMNSEFDGSLLQYLDEALYEIMEFRYGVENDFVSMDTPVMVIKDCPESGTKLEFDESEIKFSDDEIEEDEIFEEKPVLNKSKTKSSDDQARQDKIKKMRKRADDLLRDMRNRIENYNSWGDEEKTQNENESDAVYNKEKNETVDVSEEEDDCKKCLQNNNCKNPFSEDCECVEICGLAIQNELCEEKEVLLVDHLEFMLDQHIKRINISGDENPIDIKFGSQYDRQCFMISDSYLDKMSFKSLNELIAEREKVIYKSAEWSKIQNLINQLLNSSVRHDDGIVSLPLHNIPINVSIGSDFDSNIYSDKSGNLCVDFPKYVYGETPILNISLNEDFFKGHDLQFAPQIKIPITIIPMNVKLVIDDKNEWNDHLGFPVEPVVVEKFSTDKITFVKDGEPYDRKILISISNHIKDTGYGQYSSKHNCSISLLDSNDGKLYSKEIKGRTKMATSAKDAAMSSKEELLKKINKNLDKVYTSIMSN